MSNESINPSPPNRVGSFFDGLIRTILTVTPFAIGIGLISVRLPPWAEEMAKIWGPGFIVMGITTVVFFRFVPQGILVDLLKAREQQTADLHLIVALLEEIAGGRQSRLAVIERNLQTILWHLNTKAEAWQSKESGN